MDDPTIIARTASPQTAVQFRQHAYGKSGIREFLRDVIAMANADVDGPRYIVTGVRFDPRDRKQVRGVPRDIIHEDFRIPTTDLSQMPSSVAGAKLRQLADIRRMSRNSGSTTLVARLTHARLFGSDSPYEHRSAEALQNEMNELERKHRVSDEHFLFEENAKKIQLVVYNQGDETIEHASLSLVMPNHQALCVAHHLPKVLCNGKFADRGAVEQADYPIVNLKEDSIHVSSSLGDIPASAPVRVFDTPLRICVGSALEGRRLGIRYSLFARNLRSPARGQLRLIF